MQVNITTQAHAKQLKFKTLLTSFGISLLLIGTGINVQAQAPGYLGKRFLIGIELPMVAGIDIKRDNFSYLEEDKNGNFSKVSKDYFFLYYKVKPTVNLEYVLNRKSSIQVFGRFFSSKIDISPFYDTVGTEIQQFYPIDRAKAKTTSFGLKYKIFTGDGLSPVGKYISFGAEYASNKFEFQDKHFINNEGYQLIYREPQSTVSRTLVLTFGFGSQYPLGKSLIFNVGGELGLPLSIFSNYDFLYALDPSYLFDPDSETPPSEEWAKPNSKNNFFRSYIFNITVGLALIP